ncbi:hypothetical protein [Haploplasma axanthum]|uniref:Uncharacterized protein n=1 Tax=Haploplasma axanthum TaxID=29552 RepID=A0A449BDN4_HAPAX|nr:hypothetical protein [Haploplasma axanthum]VEU80542.1 Uncharacterised protein [Haploplasma axanthum]
MEDVYLIVNIIQWSLVGFFVLVNLFIGFARGTKKSLYYTLVSLFLTFILLLAISFVTIKIYFKSPEQLLSFIENYFTLSDDIKEYFVNPDISPIIFALIDVVIKIIVFIILYPIVKFILTRLIFKPIWNKKFEKSKNRQGIIVNNKLYLKPKKEKRTFIDRLGGGLLGSIRGLVVAVLILLPVIVITGSIGNETASENTTTPVSTSKNNSEIDEIIEQLTKINNGGVGLITKNLKFGEKTIDEIVFDFAFGSSKVKIKDETYKFKLSEELNSFVGSASLLYSKGYLDSSFDYGKINYQDNYQDLEKVLNNIGKSKLLKIAVPVGLNILNEQGVLKTTLGYDPFKVEHTLKAIDELKKIDWKNETKVLSTIVKNALMIGDVNRLMEIANNPNDLLLMSQKDRQSIIKVLDSFAELNVLVASNLMIESLMNNEKVLQQIKWSDTPKEYLEERLDFILSDVNFFRGEDGEIKNITKLLSSIFDDEFSDFDYSSFIKDGSFNIGTAFGNDAELIISSALDNLINIKSVSKLIPVGVDFGLHNSKNQTVNELADKIIEISDKTDYQKELTNINDIYKEILKLGLSNYNDSAMVNIIDEVLSKSENIETLKLIVNNVFEGSMIVNDVLKIVAEPLINKLVKDDVMKEFALNIINSDDFNYGNEVSDLLNIVDVLYKNTTIKDVLQKVDGKEIIGLLGTFSSLTDEDIKLIGNNNIINGVFRQAFTNEGSTNLAYNKVNEINLPTGTNTFTPKLFTFEKSIDNEGKIKEDTLTKILLIAKKLGKSEELLKARGNDILPAVINSLDDETLKNLLEIDLLTELISNFINNEGFYILGRYYFDRAIESLSKEVKLSVSYDQYYDTLVDNLFKEDLSIYESEFNGLINAIKAVEFKNIKGSNALLVNSITKELLRTNTDNKKVIDVVLESNIIYNLFDNILNTKTNENLNKELTALIAASIPTIGIDETDNIFIYSDNVYENNKIKKSEIINLIKSVSELNLTGKVTLDSFLNTVDSQKDDNETDSFDRMYGSLILQSVISNITKSEKTINYLVKMVNESQTNISLTFDELKLPTDVYENGLLKESEVKKLLRSIKILNIKKIDSSSFVPKKFTDLIGQNPKDNLDDLDRLLDSVIIHSYIDRLITSNSMGSLYAKLVNDMFNKNYDTIEAKPHNTEFGEDGRFKKSEIRSLLNSVKMLEINDLSNANEIKLDKILGFTDDELDEFLASNYLNMLLSRFLTSNTVRNMIAVSGKFDKEDFDLHEVVRNDNGDMDKLEIKGILKSLKALGITDFKNITISNEVLKNLENNNLNTVLESNYFYQVIDLTLKAQITDIPDSALEVNGKYEGYIKKDEITKLIDVLVILKINEIANGTINVDNVAVADLKKLFELDSRIVDRITSKAIITALGNDVPNDVVTDGDIERGEIGKLIEALEVLELETLGTESIKVDNVSTIKLRGLYNLNSRIIDRITSKAIITALGNDVPNDVVTDGDIERAEIGKLIEALEVLELETLGTESIKVDNVNTSKLRGLHNLDSRIIDRIISKAIITALGEDIPDEVRTGDDIERLEVEKLVNALEVLELETLGTESIKVDNVNADKLQGLYEIESKIIDRIMSKAIITALGTDVPNEVKNGDDIERIEMGRLIASLKLLSGDININSLNTLDMNGITFDEMTHIIEVDSLIVRRLISKSLISSSLSTDNSIENEIFIEKKQLINLIQSSKSIEDVTTITELIDKLNGGLNQNELVTIYIQEQQKTEEDKSRILYDTLREKVGL